MAAAKSSRPIDPGVTIGHLHLCIADIDRVRAFYVDVLGFDVTAGRARRPGLGDDGFTSCSSPPAGTTITAGSTRGTPAAVPSLMVSPGCTTSSSAT